MQTVPKHKRPSIVQRWDVLNVEAELQPIRVSFDANRPDLPVNPVVHLVLQSSVEADCPSKTSYRIGETSSQCSAQSSSNRDAWTLFMGHILSRAMNTDHQQSFPFSQYPPTRFPFWSAPPLQPREPL